MVGIATNNLDISGRLSELGTNNLGATKPSYVQLAVHNSLILLDTFVAVCYTKPYHTMSYILRVFLFILVSTNISLFQKKSRINLLKPTGYVMHQQFNIQQLQYALPTLYLCVLYLSENKQRLVPLKQHKLIGFYNRDEKCLLRGMNWVFK